MSRLGVWAAAGRPHRPDNAPAVTGCIFIAPIAAIIPAADHLRGADLRGSADADGIENVNFEDLDDGPRVPLADRNAQLQLKSATPPHRLNSYTVIKVFTGKAKVVSVLTYVISRCSSSSSS
jgi:AGZA family xanthine/uracil permease-like MFS transporter